MPDQPPTPGEPPFKGLRYFNEHDADLFFGREALTAKLVIRVRESNFLAMIVGASGSGKSSIVRAGLLPVLKRGEPLADGAPPPGDALSPDNSRHWRTHILTPTAHPLAALAAALVHDGEAAAAAQPLTLSGHTAAIYNVAFSPDRTRLITASRDRTARVYALRFEDLLTIAQSRVTRTLSVEECQKYLHVATCPSE